MYAVVVKDVSKNYKIKNEEIVVLKKVNYSFEYGKYYLITGHSGSGKSTLLHIIGLIDNLDQGSLLINGKDTTTLKNKEQAKIRNQELGYVFQEFYLDPLLKAEENIYVPMLINHKDQKEIKKRSAELLKLVNLTNRKEHFPKELSGGEQQRVAIARALANDPNIILADEPTGNLDVKNEEEIFKLLKELSEQGKCVIMVSHSKDAKKYADVILEIKDGSLNEV